MTNRVVNVRFPLFLLFLRQVKYAERAIALLRQAIVKGFQSVNAMKNDDDLKSLRPRDDFQKLLRAMQK